MFFNALQFKRLEFSRNCLSFCVKKRKIHIFVFFLSDKNDFRPVALTSCVMKSFEKYMVSVLKTEVNSILDPLQFAYRQAHSTEDAVNTVAYFITKHLENSKAYARLLFVDFSSAFNIVNPHLLIQKLKTLNVNPFLIRWYFSFLTNRTQQVRVNNTLSELTGISTGVPQGCVSSPILFTLYTNECSSCDSTNFIVKFSDDTAILSLLYENTDLSVYFSEVSRFVEWCDLNNLILNTKKTEEMIFDPRSIGDHTPVFIHET